MKYLITGATGFMGPHLVKRLTEEGHYCRCLVRSKKKAEKLLEYKNTEIVEGDITAPETLIGIADGVDRLLHMATIGHMNNFVVPEDMFESVNVNGTMNIMKEALKAGVSRIVHCSSVAAMGICDEIPSDEKTLCKPHHPYGRSKLKAEEKVRDMVISSGLPASIIRFSMVYGPGDWRDMLKLTKLAKKGLFPKIGTKPKLTPLIHVSDAVTGLLLAAEKGVLGETYLITNKTSEKFDDIRQMILDGLGIKRFPFYVPESLALLIAEGTEKLFTMIAKNPPVAKKNIESTLADRVFSIEKASLELGFNPIVKPIDGIRETVQWYKKNNWI